MLFSRLRSLAALLVFTAALGFSGFAGAAAPKAKSKAPRKAQAPAAATTDTLTFYSVSDLHYDWPAVGNYRLQRAAIKQMNDLPGTPYPQKIGGAVGVPRGVIVLGDLVENNQNKSYAAWEGDFGLKGEKLLRFPVYEGIGNHDNSGKGTGWEGLKRRNPLRADVEGISPNGYHYSWTWNGVHFVMLNIYAANEPAVTTETKSRRIDPRGSLDFLKDDLQRRVGDSGRPVVILQHFDLYQHQWYTQAQVDTLLAALKPYNVIGLIQGHSHTAKIYRAGNIDVIDDGSLKNAKADPAKAMFFVFRIQGNRLTAQQRFVSGKWGRIALDKTFSPGKPAPAASVPAAR